MQLSTAIAVKLCPSASAVLLLSCLEIRGLDPSGFAPSAQACLERRGLGSMVSQKLVFTSLHLPKKRKTAVQRQKKTTAPENSQNDVKSRRNHSKIQEKRPQIFRRLRRAVRSLHQFAWFAWFARVLGGALVLRVQIIWPPRPPPYVQKHCQNRKLEVVLY